MADLTITTANVGIAGNSLNIIQVTVGEAVSAMQPGYQDSAGKYFQTDADDADVAKAKATGVFLTPASADGEYALFVQGGPVKAGATLVPGKAYYVSPQKGMIMPEADLAAGDRAVRIGYAITTTTMQIEPKDTGVTIPA